MDNNKIENDIKMLFGKSDLPFFHDIDCPCKETPDDGDTYVDCKCSEINDFAKDLKEAISAHIQKVLEEIRNNGKIYNCVEDALSEIEEKLL